MFRHRRKILPSLFSASIASLCLSSCTFSLIPDYDYHLRCWEEDRLEGDKALEKKDLKTAELEFNSAVSEAEHLGPANFRLSYSLNRLADLYFQRGDYKAVERSCQRALAESKDSIHIRSDNPALPTLLSQEESLSLLRLAEVKLQDKKFAEASSLFSQSIEILERLWNSNSLFVVHDLIGERLATALSGLALARYALGDTNQAEQQLNKALSAVSQLAIASQLQSTIKSHYELLVQKREQGEGSAAASEAKHAGVTNVQSNEYFEKIKLAIKENRLSDAEEFLSQLNGAYLADSDYRRSSLKAYLSLAGTYKDKKQLEKAAYLCRSAIDLAHRSGDSSSLELALALQEFAKANTLLGKTDIAIKAYEVELEILSKNLNERDVELCWPITALSALYSQAGNHAKSEQLLQKKLHGLAASPASDPVKIAETLSALGFNCEKQGKHDEAAAYTRKALFLYEKGNQASNANYTFGHYFLGCDAERTRDSHKEYYHLNKAMECAEKYGHLDAEARLHSVLRLKELASQRKDYSALPALTVKAKRMLLDWAQAHRNDKPHSRDYPFRLRWIGNLLVDEGKLDMAESYFNQAIAIQKEILPANDPDLANTLAMLANAYHWNHKDALGLSTAKEMLTATRNAGITKDGTIDLVLSDYPELKSFWSEKLNATR